MAKRTRVLGVDSLSKKLKQLGVDVAEKQELALVAGALVLQNGMKVRAPKKTRTLARSIHIGGHEDQAPDYSDAASHLRTGFVPVPERSKNGVKVYVGTDVEYAWAQEFGTENTRPHPYMRPTLDADGPEAVREVGEALRDIIRASVK